MDRRMQWEVVLDWEFIWLHIWQKSYRVELWMSVRCFEIASSFLIPKPTPCRFINSKPSKPLLKQMKPSTLAVLLWSSTPTTNSFFLKLLERFNFQMILQHRFGSEESTFCSRDDSRQSSGYFLSSEPGCCCGVARDKQEHSWGKSSHASLSLIKEIWTCPDRSLSLTTHTAEVSTLTLRTAGFHWNVLRLLHYRYHSNSSLTRTVYGEHESPIHTHHTHVHTPTLSIQTLTRLPHRQLPGFLLSKTLALTHD